MSSMGHEARIATTLQPRGEPASVPGEVRKERIDAAAEWARPLAGFALGILLFETLTGLFIYFGPFSVLNQFAVLLHTLLGLLTIVPLLWYCFDHWSHRYRSNFNHYQLLGYISLASLLVLIVTGVLLTWQATFGTRLSAALDQVHVVATFVFLVALGAHLVTLVARSVNNHAARQALRHGRLACLARTAAWCGVSLAACAGAAVLYRAPELDDGFPPGYSFKYGADRPFAPSLSRRSMTGTESRMKERILEALDEGQRAGFLAEFVVDPTKHEGLASVAARVAAKLSLTPAQRSAVDGAIADTADQFRSTGAIHPRRLAGSDDCGRCHEQIAAEWAPSAHRYASMDFVFQKVQENFAREKAPEAVRYCAGCHDPIALFAGAKNVGNETMSAEGSHEGVSCLACHSMVQTDVRGNGDYTIEPPERYLYEFTEGRAARFVSDFLIRAFPRQHATSYNRPLYKTAEACGACHKQFVDQEVNDFGWVQGQNQYDSWRKSRWHKEGDVAGTISCRECHMPLVDSTDPAAGDKDDPNRHPRDGKHRSHRFLGANQFVPRYHQLPGAEEHCALTVQWLRGELPIPEIADRWTTGPVVRLDVQAPPTAAPGETIAIQTVVTNNKAGHDFPTGPMDMIEGWVEITVTDAAGRVVFTASRADERGYLANPQIVFKAELIDRAGELIGKHELWRLVGARFKRVLFPGVSDAATFTFQCPGLSEAAPVAALGRTESHVLEIPGAIDGDELRVAAVVWYCKFSAPFLDRLFGEEARQRSEVTEVARAETRIRIVREQATANFPTP